MKQTGFGSKLLSLTLSFSLFTTCSVGFTDPSLILGSGPGPDPRHLTRTKAAGHSLSVIHQLTALNPEIARDLWRRQQLPAAVTRFIDLSVKSELRSSSNDTWGQVRDLTPGVHRAESSFSSKMKQGSSVRTVIFLAVLSLTVYLGFLQVARFPSGNVKLDWAAASLMPVIVTGVFLVGLFRNHLLSSGRLFSISILAAALYGWTTVLAKPVLNFPMTQVGPLPYMITLWGAAILLLHYVYDQLFRMSGKVNGSTNTSFTSSWLARLIPLYTDFKILFKLKRATSRNGADLTSTQQMLTMNRRAGFLRGTFWHLGPFALALWGSLFSQTLGAGTLYLALYQGLNPNVYGVMAPIGIVLLPGLLAAWWLGEKFTARKLIGYAMVFSGMAAISAVSLTQASVQVPFAALALGLLSAVFYGLRQIFHKQLFNKNLDALSAGEHAQLEMAVNRLGYFLGTVTMIGIAVIQAIVGNQPIGWFTFLVPSMAILTIANMFVWTGMWVLVFFVTRHIHASRLTPILATFPFWTMLWQWVVTGQLNPSLIAIGGLVLAGGILASYQKPTQVDGGSRSELRTSAGMSLFSKPHLRTIYIISHVILFGVGLLAFPTLSLLAYESIHIGAVINLMFFASFVLIGNAFIHQIYQWYGYRFNFKKLGAAITLSLVSGAVTLLGVMLINELFPLGQEFAGTTFRLPLGFGRVQIDFAHPLIAHTVVAIPRVLMAIVLEALNLLLLDLPFRFYRDQLKSRHEGTQSNLKKREAFYLSRLYSLAAYYFILVWLPNYTSVLFIGLVLQLLRLFLHVSANRKSYWVKSWFIQNHRTLLVIFPLFYPFVKLARSLHWLITPKETISVEAKSRVLASAVWHAYEQYQKELQALNDRALSLFEQGDWAHLQVDYQRRLDLYSQSIENASLEISRQIGNGFISEQTIWDQARTHFDVLVINPLDKKLADAFFYTVKRRFIPGTESDIRFIAEDVHLFRGSEDVLEPVFTSYKRKVSTRAAVETILSHYGFKIPYEDHERDVNHITDLVNRQLHLEEGEPNAKVERFEMLNPIFTRFKKIYIVGRIRVKANTIPLVLVFDNHSQKLVLDQVVMESLDVSRLFGFTHSQFTVVTDNYQALVNFLHELMPRKHLSQIYRVIGQYNLAKAEILKDLFNLIRKRQERFRLSEGVKGKVVISFSLPSSDMMIRVLKDRPDKPLSPREFEAKHYFARHVYKAGRIVEMIGLRNVRFPKAAFEADVLKELLEKSTDPENGIVEDGEFIILKRFFVQRYVIPLDIFFQREKDPEIRRRILLDLGQLHKDLARVNIFNVDFLPHNHGVIAAGTANMRVVLFDLDAIELLTDQNFLSVPRYSRPVDDGDFDLDYFMYGGDAEDMRMAAPSNDQYPEQFELLKDIPLDLVTEFMRVHGDLIQPDFYLATQRDLWQQADELVRTFPYSLLARRRANPIHSELRHFSLAERLQTQEFVVTTELDEPDMTPDYWKLIDQGWVHGMTITDLPLISKVEDLLKRYQAKKTIRQNPFAILHQTTGAIVTVAAGARFRGNIRNRILRMVEENAGGILAVASGGLIRRLARVLWLEWLLPMNSFKILRMVKKMKQAGIIPKDFLIMGVENPLIGDPVTQVDRLEEKIEAGAEAIMTQPPLLWHQFEAWWREVEKRGLNRRVPIIIGFPFITSPANLRFWYFLTGVSSHHLEAQALLSEFEEKQNEGAEAFAKFRQEFSEGLLRKIRTLPHAAGIHLFPLKGMPQVIPTLKANDLRPPLHHIRRIDRLIGLYDELGVQLDIENVAYKDEHVKHLEGVLSVIYGVIKNFDDRPKRITINRVFYKQHFLDSVMVRDIVGSSDWELTIDLKSFERDKLFNIKRLRHQVQQKILDRKRPERKKEIFITAGPFKRYAHSLIRQWNEAFWQHVKAMMKALKRDYRDTIAGSPDTEAPILHYNAERFLLEDLLPLREQEKQTGVPPQPVAYVEGGVASIDYARGFVDQLKKLAEDRGLADLLTNVTYVLADLSSSIIEQAKQELGKSRNGIKFDMLQLDAANPTQALEKYQGQILRGHLTNILDNLPTDYFVRRETKSYIVESRPRWSKPEIIALARQYQIKEDELIKDLQNLSETGVQHFLGKYRQSFHRSAYRTPEQSDELFYRFWYDLYGNKDRPGTGLRLEEQLVPINDLEQFHFLSQTELSGALLAEALDEVEGDIRMPLSNHAIDAVLAWQKLLHPDGVIEIFDIVVDRFEDFQTKENRPNKTAKYDGSAVDWINGALLRVIGKALIPGFHMTVENLGRFGKRFKTMSLVEIRQNQEVTVKPRAELRVSSVQDRLIDLTAEAEAQGIDLDAIAQTLKQEDYYVEDLVREVLRDAIQFHPSADLLTADNLKRLVSLLEIIGLKRIEPVSFVRTDDKGVPLMRFSPEVAEFMRERKQKGSSLIVSYLVFKRDGVEAVLQHDPTASQIAINIALSPNYGASNTLSQSQHEFFDNRLAPQLDWLEEINEARREISDSKLKPVGVSAYLSNAWGAQDLTIDFDDEKAFTGWLEEIKGWIRKFQAKEIEEVVLSDTTGEARPADITKLFSALIQDTEFKDIKFAFHGHDSGNGLLNVFAALKAGVRMIDTSIGNLGGSPFSETTHTYKGRKPGNITTEDLIFLLKAKGVPTNIDFDRLLEVVREFERILSDNFVENTRVLGLHHLPLAEREDLFKLMGPKARRSELKAVEPVLTQAPAAFSNRLRSELRLMLVPPSTVTAQNIGLAFGRRDTFEVLTPVLLQQLASAGIPVVVIAPTSIEKGVIDQINHQTANEHAILIAESLQEAAYQLKRQQIEETRFVSTERSDLDLAAPFFNVVAYLPKEQLTGWVLSQVKAIAVMMQQSRANYERLLQAA
ncbi:MAG: hypothetical protein COV74_07855 [Candidatus Omnitrophica bacterium CG11_big_fil_rev_8_21_14_0_20_45_26]|uniref:Pyruvate carboxyltransferase domain-containing protein n=1 Tax=Candidatus Abzuiibacterium crystallinum TaxID=1974748 RepID=A0A2H0LQ29_9BACT|nr:MAG: hypothetical protein COV74_07855 [Candidatus Omnitrophica bacterium CG11_big_fil_rev_8_21_14_0_20_45_26]PIW65136.1 MAG: hypothetical protein COW12_02895 [Candidatus Omnitrophica bacterium CG12_big_fil_rev_8_21_14_0_65_45_16]